MAAKPRALKPVLVHWLDSQAQPGWRPYERDTDLTCTTIGHLVERTESRIVLALNKSPDGYGDYMTIPRCSVKSIKHLAPAQTRRRVAHG